MSNPYIGEIRMFGGSFAPVGWLFCQGQSLSISQYETLFTLIGTTYGGDGQETFALPDLRSRMPVHQGGGYPLGGAGGAEAVTLNSNQNPIHTHQAAAAAVATSPSPGSNVWASYANNSYSSQAPTTPMAANALNGAGQSQPHDNMSPYLAINFILATEGIYPSPS